MVVFHGDADDIGYVFPILKKCRKILKYLLSFSARAPNDAAGSIPRLVFAPSNNPPRRGDIILSVLRPKAWIPIAIMLAIAGLTVAIVRAFSGANHTKKDL